VWFHKLIFCCMTIYYNAVELDTAKPFKKLILRITMFSTMYSHLFWNITPLESLLFSSYSFLFINIPYHFQFSSYCLSWAITFLFHPFFTLLDGRKKWMSIMWKILLLIPGPYRSLRIGSSFPPILNRGSVPKQLW
jgi:hypothetical protein